VSLVVITGASSGIGLRTAVYFAERGHTVVATMRNLARSDDLKAAAEDCGVAVELRELDVEDYDQVKSVIDGVLADHGQIDVLINNAGLLMMSPWELTPIEDIERVFRTNFFGAVRCAQAVLPSMRGRESGAIINVASIAGLASAPIQGAYCASKAALISFTESLAVEIRPYGLKVAAVVPGFHRTPMLVKVWEGRPPQPTHPYADLERRWAMLYKEAGAEASEPEAVARAIEEVLGEEDVTSRLVGPDCQVFLSGRATIGQAGWLAYGDRQTDEEWLARFASDFPIPT
jgi:NAD(P)-dependent dehydrogenase (short-subunit alcohol dehydrogenase family)